MWLQSKKDAARSGAETYHFVNDGRARDATMPGQTRTRVPQSNKKKYTTTSVAMMAQVLPLCPVPGVTLPRQSQCFLWP